MKTDHTYKVTLGILLLSHFLLFTGSVQAEIYKCVNAEGGTFYNDKPCPKTDEETKLKAAKDPKNGYIPPKFIPLEEGNGTKGIVIGKQSGKSSTDDEEDDAAEGRANNTASGRGTSTAGSSSKKDGKKTASRQKNSHHSNEQKNDSNANKGKGERVKLSDIDVIILEGTDE